MPPAPTPHGDDDFANRAAAGFPDVKEEPESFAQASGTKDLRAHDLGKKPLPRRRCANRKCLQWFVPESEGQCRCQKCRQQLQVRKAEPVGRSGSWWMNATSRDGFTAEAESRSTTSRYARKTTMAIIHLTKP